MSDPLPKFERPCSDGYEPLLTLRYDGRCRMETWIDKYGKLVIRILRPRGMKLTDVGHCARIKGDKHSLTGGSFDA